jgi:transmembrane 9 superfamily member 3
MAGCSPALYLFAYCVRYFFAGTRMTGVFQGCFYFGWSLLLCLSLGTATGAVGFLASAAFVRRIYRSVKCD